MSLVSPFYSLFCFICVCFSLFLFVVVVVFDILLLIFVVIVSRLNEESFCVSANYDIINRAWITKLFVCFFYVFFYVFLICLFVFFLVISCYSEPPQFRFEFCAS